MGFGHTCCLTTTLMDNSSPAYSRAWITFFAIITLAGAIAGGIAGALIGIALRRRAEITCADCAGLSFACKARKGAHSSTMKPFAQRSRRGKILRNPPPLMIYNA